MLRARNAAEASDRGTYTARQALDLFESRRALVTQRLARSPYLAGDRFTAADISVTYALELGKRAAGVIFNDTEREYVARTTARDGYKRAMDAAPAQRRGRPGRSRNSRRRRAEA